MTNILKPYQNINKIELGIDEAGRGCLFGDLFIAGVIFSNNIDELINEHKITIKELESQKKVHVFSLLTLHKTTLAQMDERSKITKYIEHLDIMKEHYNVEFRGFNM